LTINQFFAQFVEKKLDFCHHFFPLLYLVELKLQKEIEKLKNIASSIMW